VDELETAAETDSIAVVGVTDYMTIDGYERLYDAKVNHARLSSVALLIPNIEFRMMPMTDDGKALNIHLLIDPSAFDHIDRIKRSLRNLKVSYNGEPYGCQRQDLIDFGKAQNGALDDDRAYRFGIEQFKPSWEIFRDWLKSESWLRKNSLVGVANGKDGISGLPLDGFASTRDELLRLCDMVFSGNPNDRLHYLGQKSGNSVEDILRQYRSLKPCVHGSDAHEVTTLFKPDKDRKCWIKGDPTFQGLRQILWEPEARVHIGPIHPQQSDSSKIIQAIELSDTKGWFTGSRIELNSGLVSVIGEKGTGKTAVADMVAMAAGIEPEPESQASFINKGRIHLAGLKVELEWANGARSVATLPDHRHETPTPLIRYLSQDFVERLCTQDIGGTELQRAIEDVVFRKLSEEQKEGYSSFRELRTARETSTNARREKYRGELATLNKEIERLRQALAQRAQKENEKRGANNETEELKKQLPEASKSVDQGVLDALNLYRAKRKEIEDLINALNRRRRVIVDAINEYRQLMEIVTGQVTTIQETLIEIGIQSSTVDRLAPTWDNEVIGLLEADVILIDQQITGHRGRDEDTEDLSTLSATSKAIARLQEEISKDEVSRRRLLDLQKQIQERSTIAERLQKEIADLDIRITKELKQKEDQRLALYLKFFEALKEDEKGLQELYAPMQKAIEQLGGSVEFSIAVGYHVDSRDWLGKSLRFYDNRKGGCESLRDSIQLLVETELSPAWKKGDLAILKDAFKKFYDLVDAPEFVSKYGTGKLTLVELYDWMFSVDHVALTYKIMYDGTELEYLSPGTRGIALLVLYLLMDEDDTRPLVIDQPEGNLDSSSVYKQLVPYMRQAKLRRQIILVTHNPNLVVATDAEQVIVATANRPASQPYPCITYTCGSLEHSEAGPPIGTREAVCLHLEGGKDAFRVRENRYALEE
jgi:hypothetical protein